MGDKRKREDVWERTLRVGGVPVARGEREDDARPEAMAKALKEAWDELPPPSDPPRCVSFGPHITPLTEEECGISVTKQSLRQS